MKRLKTLLFVAAGSMLAMSSCCDKHSISGTFEGLGDDTLYVQYKGVNESNLQMVTDTVVAKGGKFTCDVPDSLDVMAYITFTTNAPLLPNGHRLQSEGRVVLLNVQPGQRVKVTGDLTDPNYIPYQVDGTGFSSEYATQRDAYKSQLLKIDSIRKVQGEVMAVPPSPQQDSIVRAMWEGLSECYKQRDQIIRDYIKANPDADLSAYYALQLQLPDFGEYYPNLSERVKNGTFKQLLGEQDTRYQAYLKVQETKKSIVPGAQAPEFTLPGLDGKEVSLSSLRGKYVVLDFWGSWCGWCIKGVPEMKKYYDKYKRKIEFVGIDCRDSEENWKKAVSEHKMNWLQLRNMDEDADRSVSAKYAIEGYPTKIIIDREGKIVEVFVGETPDFYEKLDQLLR